MALHPVERALTVGDTKNRATKNREAGQSFDQHSTSVSPATSPLPSPQYPLLVVVLGPTASGKTSLALALARKFQGEIVNCDSVAMYREFEIGTAKPSHAERAEIPHHLLDCVDPLGDFSAGEYARQARSTLKEIVSREKSSSLKTAGGLSHPLPIVTGGTGLYLRALLEGLFPGPERSEDLRVKLRNRERKLGAGYLHKILRRLDAKAAGNIHANDVPKVIRAIEVCMSSRQPITKLWQQGTEPLRGFRILRLGLNPDRESLYDRINQRAANMFDQGLVEETQHLLKKYGTAARPLAALGYKQAFLHLKGELSREQAISAAQQAHRNYAKRQLTWFRREPNVYWLSGSGDDPKIQLAAISRVTSVLK